MLLDVGLSSLMIDCLLLIHAVLQIITDKKSPQCLKKNFSNCPSQIMYFKYVKPYDK